MTLSQLYREISGGLFVREVKIRYISTIPILLASFSRPFHFSCALHSSAVHFKLALGVVALQYHLITLTIKTPCSCSLLPPSAVLLISSARTHSAQAHHAIVKVMMQIPSFSAPLHLHSTIMGTRSMHVMIAELHAQVKLTFSNI